MEAILPALGLLLLFLVCLLALVSLVFGFPGTWIVLGAALLYAWWTGFAEVGWPTLGWLAALALAGEVAEFWLGAAVATRERPSWRVTFGVLVGGFVGGVLGLPFLFGVGALLGALLGAGAGAALAVASEGGSEAEARRAALAAAKGRFLGFVVKLAFGVAMVSVLMAAVVG
ncbi:MAG: hypothetical protein KatS3mg076_2390 [Candidatus Binatia bacterium]|nr:MAG: hypothetical protein KatS3mg076_2390 [Candidatus Binatia bacterium]